MSREGKIHLVESCSFPRSTYKNVTNESSFQKLKEAAQHIHNGRKLTEATVIQNAKKVLKENKIDEDVQVRVLKNLQEVGANLDNIELWQFPISRINTKQNPNSNGRVYNRELWENIINNQVEVWKGGTGLADHPEGNKDGEFMKQSIVWLDGFIGDDDIIYGIGSFIGEGGALARQIIGLGGRVGFSSSGYGDFLSDGITVDPSTYEIDRLADLVLNPSQGVFGDYSDMCKITPTNNNKKLKESIQNMKENKKVLVENKTIDAIKEAFEDEETTISKLCKIADDLGFEVKLQEGAMKDIAPDLALELLVQEISAMDKDAEKIDIRAFWKEISNATEVSEEDLEKSLKEKLEKASISEEEVNKLFSESLNEEEKDSDTEEGSEEEDSEDNEDSDEEEESDEDSEELEESSGMTLEEQLLVEHYNKNLKKINKKPNTLWEEKIQDLENLTKKLQEAKLSTSVTKVLNKKSQKLVENIMKEARLAIQEGFKAKDICSDLGINSISKLGNIKEKLEDYVSLEECLDKASKEANKYKALYEAKTQYAQTEAEENFDKEKVLNETKEALLESQKNAERMKQFKNLTELESLRAKKQVKTLQEEVETLKRSLKLKNRKLNEANDTLKEADKTISMLKRNLEISDRRVSESTDMHKVANRKYTEVSRRLQEAENRIQSLEEELSEKTNTISKLKKRLVESTDMAQSLEQQLSRTKVQKAQVAKKLSESNLKLSDLDKKLSLKENKLEKLNEDYKDLAQQKIQVQRNLKLKEQQNLSKAKALQEAKKEVSLLSGKISDIENEKRLEERKERLQNLREKARKEESLNSFWDENKMFRNNKGIDNLLEENHIENKKAFKDVKTLKEAENRLLFSNSLLSDEADMERDNIDVPKEDVKSLSELFN